LLIAMICRTILIPMQIYFDPIWVQLMADTLPVMTFASAWTLLVSFFVKLVGVALGATGSGDFDSHHHQQQQQDGTAAAVTLPIGTVIQLTAYVLYIILMGMFFVNHVAAVLLYAFLSCIYAALLGTSLYFCPRLLTLLYPTLASMMNTTSNGTNGGLTQSVPSHNNLRSAGTASGSIGGEGGKGTSSSSSGGSGNAIDENKSKYSALAMRLALCGILCVVVFGARTIGFCRKIVSPQNAASWWWQYGCLELFPAVIFLVLIKPKSSGGSSGQGGGATKSPPHPPSSFATTQKQQQQRHHPQQLFRSNSYGSGGGGGNGGRRGGENTPLLKSAGGYGSGGGISSGPPSPSVPR
jgi:hypothetical protein